MHGPDSVLQAAGVLHREHALDGEESEHLFLSHTDHAMPEPLLAARGVTLWNANLNHGDRIFCVASPGLAPAPAPSPSAAGDAHTIAPPRVPLREAMAAAAGAALRTTVVHFSEVGAEALTRQLLFEQQPARPAAFLLVARPS